MPREVVLGLHGFSFHSPRQMHDAGVCLLVDGQEATVVGEERRSGAADTVLIGPFWCEQAPNAWES